MTVFVAVLPREALLAVTMVSWAVAMGIMLSRILGFATEWGVMGARRRAWLREIAGRIREASGPGEF